MPNSANSPLFLGVTSLKDIQYFFVPEEERSSVYHKATALLDPYLRDPELAKQYKKAMFELQVCANILSLGDFLYFGGSPKSPNLYFLSPNSPSPIYTPLSLPTLRRLTRSCSPVLLTAKQVTDIIETFLDLPDPNQQISRRVLAISDKLYWDRESQSLTTDPLPNRCFYRLFDTTDEEKNVPSFPKSTFNEDFSRQVTTSYSDLTSILDKIPNHEFPNTSEVCQHVLPTNFPFILDWADGDYALYWDLIKILATTFMRRRPDVSFFLTGTGFNGKSQYVGLLHTIFGTNNTSRIPLSDIGDAHMTKQLQFTLFNAPDDEGGSKKDSINNHTKVFKQLASHETLSLPVLYSVEPMKLKADFMCVFPMNIFPRWQGEDTSALTRRTVLVPFTHDFRTEAKHYSNFAKETYTPQILAQLVGEALAVAHFYKDCPLTFSKTLEGKREQVELENDTPRVYKKLFKKYFDGFQHKKMLYMDYRNWCLQNDAGTIVNQASFRTHFDEYLDNSNKERTKFIGIDGQEKRPYAYRIKSGTKAKTALYAEMPLSHLGISNQDYYGGTVGRAIDNGFSIVDILEKQGYNE